MCLVRQVVTVTVHANDQKVLGIGAGERKGLKMKWYAGSLVSLPKLTEGLIAIGGKRIRSTCMLATSSTRTSSQPTSWLTIREGGSCRVSEGACFVVA